MTFSDSHFDFSVGYDKAWDRATTIMQFDFDEAYSLNGDLNRPALTMIMKMNQDTEVWEGMRVPKNWIVV